jgi:STE24 endopeptidase
MWPRWESVFLALLLIKVAVQLVLNGLNAGEAKRNAPAMPQWVVGVVDETTYARSIRYTLAKARFAAFSIVYDAAILSVVVFSGLLRWLFEQLGRWLGAGVWAHGLYLLCVGLIVSAAVLPLSYWAQFRLEGRFGFNRSTRALWVLDQIKGLGLAIAVGYPLVTLLLWLIRWLGDGWWVWGFAVVMSFQLGVLLVFPKLILPLFNKLTPLPEGDLRERLVGLAQRTGFRVANIEVMDGSKRSAHSNAFFTGFGRLKRIVLLDTLMASLGSEEIEAVLAHEIGHSKRGHVAKSMLLSSATTLVGLYVAAQLIRRPWLYEAFGLPAGEPAPMLALLSLIAGVVTFWIVPLANMISRKHEFEADAFAWATVGRAEPMMGALRKLSTTNLSNLTPHGLYSRFYYSHPTLRERERALDRLGKRSVQYRAQFEVARPRSRW